MAAEHLLPSPSASATPRNGFGYNVDCTCSPRRRDSRVEVDAIECTVGLQQSAELAERGEVPFGGLSRPVQRDRERGCLAVTQVQLHDVHLGPAEFEHDGDATVASDQAAGGLLDDERLDLLEPREARLDRPDVLLVVQADVGRVEMQLRERDAADGQC
jgi:hypothetical protein